MAYEPNPLPENADPDDIKRYIQEELRRVNADVIDAGQETIKWDILYEEPAKPRTGMVAYADGSTWNPNSGEGFYYYSETQEDWVLMGASDYYMNVAQGNIDGSKPVNKFGKTVNVDTGIPTDLWDGADAGTTQLIWDAPTQARTHRLWSDDPADHTASSGAHIVQLYGLLSWSATAEATEQVTMLGTTTAVTTNQYVIVHRLKIIPDAGSGINAGNIKAEASADGTVSAQILAGEGQTQMAIYGISSRMEFYMTNYYLSLNKGVKAAAINSKLLVNPAPEINANIFLTKHTKGLIGTGSSEGEHSFKPPFKISGPAIIKLQAASDTLDTEVDGGFGGVLKDV